MHQPDSGLVVTISFDFLDTHEILVMASQQRPNHCYKLCVCLSNAIN
jgi:hypothetical protein